MKIKLDFGAHMPTRAHVTEAGLEVDLRAWETQIVPAKESAIFKTGVHIELPKGSAGIYVRVKRLTDVKHGISSTGLIDKGHTGEITVKLYNHSGFDYTVNKGDKISQLVIVPVQYEELELVENFESVTDRGDSGFGSTGR